MTVDFVYYHCHFVSFNPCIYVVLIHLQLHVSFLNFRFLIRTRIVDGIGDMHVVSLTANVPWKSNGVIIISEGPVGSDHC